MPLAPSVIALDDYHLSLCRVNDVSARVAICHATALRGSRAGAEGERKKTHTKKKTTQKAKLSAVDSVSKLKASRCCQTLGASLETLARPRRAN